jgi:TetR/AcrR family transcriptional repressor of nem operon
MPLSKQHRARTRRAVAAAAGRLFRRAGYAAVGVDALMAEAGLTRGGFYAHFASKEALFAEIVATDHGLIRHLARRDPDSPTSWREQTALVFADYLNSAHLAEVAEGCSFAALTGDVARSAEPVREGYRAGWRRALGEVLRGAGESWRHALLRASGPDRERAALVLGTAIGTVAIARALAPSNSATALLNAASAQVLAWLGADAAAP